MANGFERQSGRKLAKVALAKSNRVQVDIGGIAGDTVEKLNNLSSSLGVTYNASNVITNNDTTEQLEAQELHGVISGMSIAKNVNPRYFDIATGVYYINGVRKEYSGGTIDTSSILGGEFASAIINATGAVTLLPNTFPTTTQLQSALELTAFSKTSSLVINKIGDSFFIGVDFIKQIYLRHKFFEGTIFSRFAGRITESTTPLQLDIQGGDINTPDARTKTVIAETDLIAETMYHVSGNYEIQPDAVLVVSNTQYDDGTDLASIPNNKFVAHTLLRSSRTDTIYFTYGREYFNTQTQAESVDYDLGAFEGYLGSEVEPLALIVVKEGVANIVSITDIRNSVSRSI